MFDGETYSAGFALWKFLLGYKKAMGKSGVSNPKTVYFYGFVSIKVRVFPPKD